MMNRVYHIISTVFVVFLLAGCGENTTATEYLANAERYLSEGKTAAATIELKNALKSDADSAQARWMLGKIYFDQDDMPSADKELRHARQLGVSAELVSPLLAQAFLRQEKFAELQAMSVEKLTGDSLATLLSAQGLAKLVQGKGEAASELIEQAIKEAPQSTYALMAKARLLQVDGDITLVRAQLDTIFATDPNYSPALSLLGDVESRQNQLESAEQAYTRAIDTGTSSTAEFADRLKRSLVRLGLKKYDAAQSDATYLIGASPRHPSANYVQGLIYFQQKKVAKAKAALELALPVKELYPQVLYYIAAVNLLEENKEQAAAYASEFYTIAPNSVAGRKLLAAIRLDERDYGQVEELLRPVLALGMNDASAMNLLANALLPQGKTDEAIDLLAEIAELEPDSPTAQMRLGAGMLASGEQAGVEHIESALRLNPDYQQGEILLVLNYLRQNELDKALQAAEAYRDRKPDIATPYNLLGRVHLAANRENEARAALLKAREVAPGDPFACQGLALFAVKDKEYDVAQGYYQEILEYHQNYVPALVKLAALKQLSGDEKAMVAYLEQAIEANPTALQPRLILARYYLTQKRPEKVAALFNGLDGGDENPEILHVVGMAQLAEQDYHNAQASFEKLLVLKPDAAKGHYLLAQTFEGIGRLDDVEGKLRTSIELAPEYVEPQLALVRLLLKQKKNKAFELELKKLEQLIPQSPVVWQLQIARARLQGDEKGALEIYQKAYQKLPSTSTMLGLGGQKSSLGDTKGALSLYKSWLADNPEDAPARMALASLYIKTNNTELAIEQYTSVLAREKDNLVALNNLAWFLRETKSKKAVEYARRAVDIDANAAAIQDTLAMALLADGQLKEAKAAIAKGLSKTPGDPSMRYHRALINLAAGQNSSGLSELKRVLSAGDTFPERKDAEALLEKLDSVN